MKAEANEPMLGKFLNGRYQVVKVLSAGAFGHTYIAEDTWLIGNPQCAIKYLKPNSNHPKQWQICKRLFTSEAEALKKLGKHDQIVQLLDCFEDDQGFYLVQELILGEQLSAELPTSKHCSKRWSEDKCVEMLREVLGILEFVHTQGVIHGDIKPNNLIRRTSDGKLVLIDFGVAHQIDPTQVKPRVIPIQQSISPVAIRSLGYIPAEQFCGHPCPSSDVYALGMIAIEVLTGLNPAQLKVDPNTGEVNWQQHVSVSDPLACVINHMVRYDFKDRYQSATDARIVMKKLAIRSEEQGVKKEDLSDQVVSDSPSVVPPPIKPIADDEELALCLHTVSRLGHSSPKATFPSEVSGNRECSSNKWYYARELALSCWPKLPPLLTGMGAGMATSNALAISFGLYTLLYASPSNPGLDLLVRAMEQYQAGNFDEAIALAKSVPTNSSAYQESVKAAQEWRSEWKIATAQFKAVEEAFNQGHWRDVFDEARKMPNIAFWEQKIEPFLEQAKLELEVEAQQLLEQAQKQASVKDFSTALALLKQIPQETPTGAKIKPKLTEYSQKQQIKAESLLQKAYHRASKRDFSGALQYLSQIPEDTPSYNKAQVKMAEYSQKQHFKEEVNRQVELARAVSEPKRRLSAEPFQTGPFISSNSKKTISELNPGSHLKEVSPQPVRGTPVRR